MVSPTTAAELARLDSAETVYLCGAGISTEAPSSLPSGDELALLVFNLAMRGREQPFPAEALGRARGQIRAGGLRLEVICDLLSAELPPLTVVSVFSLLRSSLPNRLHFTLALLSPAAVITTNQDRLLEDAGALVGRPLRPFHLHGRCDRLGSIITTVTDYVHGLPGHKQRRLARLLDGRDLVVVGYSGRDLDVMGCLLDTDPRHVFWIEHDTGAEPGERPPELVAVERHFGERWTRLSRSTGDWLVDLLNPSQRRELEQALAGAAKRGEQAARARQARRISARFARLEDSSCALAVGNVLRHTGMQGEARSGFERLREAGQGGDRVALALAASAFELNEFPTAISAFHDFRQNGAEPYLRAEALLGEVESLRNVSRFGEARDALGQLEPIAAEIADAAKRRRIVAAGTCQLGGLARMDGDLNTAARAYRETEEHSLAAGDVRDMLESRTWRTEILLAQGRYRQALAESNKTLTYAPLANNRWLSWARFVHCEALCAAGRQPAGLDLSHEVLAEFARYGNPMGEAWTLMTAASFLRSHDSLAAAGALGAATEAVAHYGGPLVYAEARLLWEEGELKRASGDRDGAWARLDSYREHVRRHFPDGHLWLDAHGDALGVELARDGRTENASHLAAQAQSRYRKLGANGAARRMAVSGWAAGVRSLDGEPRFVRTWEKKGFALELTAIRQTQMHEYCSLNVWFVP